MHQAFVDGPLKSCPATPCLSTIHVTPPPPVIESVHHQWCQVSGGWNMVPPTSRHTIDEGILYAAVGA